MKRSTMSFLVISTFYIFIISSGCNVKSSATKLEKQLPTEEIRGDDSLFFSMERTPCYGRCPTYDVQIYKSGYALYHGIRFVEQTGYYFTRIPEDKMKEITNYAKEIGYFELEDVYDSNISDVPSTVTTLRIKGNTKTVQNRFNGPQKLREFENFVDKILNELNWGQLREHK